MMSSSSHVDAWRRRRPTIAENDDRDTDRDPNERDAHMSDETIDVSPTNDGGVMKTITATAPSDALRPETNDVVRVHYTGTLEDGTTFDSSRERKEPFEFTLGTHRVIHAWDVGVATMRVGERATFTCRGDYAYGERGAPPKIPPNATLVFDVELLSFTSHRDFSGDGGVRKTEEVAAATAHAGPNAGDEVTVTYDAMTKDGKTVIVGETTVTCAVSEAPCSGIGIALLKMKKGEKMRLAMSAAYAAGLPGAAEGQDAIVTVSLDAIHKVEPVEGVEGAKKKELVEGEGYEKPNDGAACFVEYEKRSASGAVEETKSLEVTIGEEHVPEDLEAALMMMRLNEQALITMADGTEYTAKLTKLERAKEQYAMNNTEKIEAAEKYKSSGNDAYKGGNFKRATKKYESALKYVEQDTSFSDEEKQASKKLKLSLNLNAAAVAIKQKSWATARKSSQKALDIESSNEKALYRHAQASMELQEYDESRRSLGKILDGDAEHAEAQRMLARLKVLEAHQAKKDAKIFGGMFKKIDLYADVKVEEKKEEEETAAPVVPDVSDVPPMDAAPAPDAGEPFGVHQV